MNSNNVKANKYPLYLAIIYLISTVIIYFFGEYIWIIPNPIKLLLFLLITYLGFWVGGILGLKNIHKKKIFIKKFLINIEILFRFSCIFSIITYIVMVNYYGQGFIFNNILSSGGDVYIQKASRLNYERNYLVQILSWFWAFTYIYIPVGIIYFKKLKKNDKILLFVTILISIFYWLSIGTMKGIGDIIIQILPCYFVNKYQKRQDRNIVKKKRKNHYVILSLFIVLLFLIIFDKVQDSRQIAIYGKVQESNYIPSTISPFVKGARNIPLPNGIKLLMFYLSHGYTGLAYCLELPFKWTGFIGFSRSLTEIFESRFTLQISSITYLQRCEAIYGWHNGMVWSTLFPWFAGDVSFYGIPFLMLILGYVFISTWKRCLICNKDRNVFDIVLFTQWCLMILFIPCNNQIFQSRQSLFAIILLVIMRIFVKVKTDGLDQN